MIRCLLFAYFLSGCATATPESINISRKRGFHVLTIDRKAYPEATTHFNLTFNGFEWHKYRVGEQIMLIKVSGLPNTVALTPVDKNGNQLEKATVFDL